MSAPTETGPYKTLLVEEREDRVVVTLHRPDSRNAISGRMIRELHAVCEQLEENPNLLLLTGHGGVFAGGADIGELLARGRDEALQGINSRLFERVRRLPMPTLAAVDGWALGGGAELSYACDLRIAGPDAVFGNPEPGLGILAAAGACWRLPELVGSPSPSRCCSPDGTSTRPRHSRPGWSSTSYRRRSCSTRHTRCSTAWPVRRPRPSGSPSSSSTRPGRTRSPTTSRRPCSSRGRTSGTA